MGSLAYKLVHPLPVKTNKKKSTHKTKSHKYSLKLSVSVGSQILRSVLSLTVVGPDIDAASIGVLAGGLLDGVLP